MNKKRFSFFIILFFHRDFFLRKRDNKSFHLKPTALNTKFINSYLHLQIVLFHEIKCFIFTSSSVNIYLNVRDDTFLYIFHIKFFFFFWEKISRFKIIIFSCKQIFKHQMNEQTSSFTYFAFFLST